MRTGPGNRSVSERTRREQRVVRVTSDAPRMRDVPAPRKNQSAIGPLFGQLFAWPYRFALSGLYRSGILPWQLTALSLVANGVVGWLLVRGDRLVPGLLLI